MLRYVCFWPKADIRGINGADFAVDGTNIIEELKNAVENLPGNQDKHTALTFLKLPNIKLLTRRWNSVQPAAHWLEIYRIKFSNPKASVFHGGKELLEKLAKLPADAQISMAGFEVPGGLGLFWRDAAGQLIGFAI